MRAVLPVSVKMAMAPMGRSSAACAMASQMVSATESPRCSRRRRVWPRSPMLHSASTTMRAMMETDSRGYWPLAVSAESMTASVPSKMALATSLASARVGRGFSIIDSSICVAVMTGLRQAGGAANDVLLNDRNFFGRHFDAEIAARDHDAVGGFENFFQMIDGLRLFELGDHGDIAAVRGDDLLDHLHIGGGAHEGERHSIDAVV